MTTENNPQEQGEQLNPALSRSDYMALLEARDGKGGWMVAVKDVEDTADLCTRPAAEIAVFLAQLLTSGSVIALRMEVGKPVRMKFRTPATKGRVDENYLKEAKKVADNEEAKATTKVPQDLSQWEKGDYHDVLTKLVNLVLGQDQEATKGYANSVLEILRTQKKQVQQWFPGDHT